MLIRGRVGRRSRSCSWFSLESVCSCHFGLVTHISGSLRSREANFGPVETPYSIAHLDTFLNRPKMLSGKIFQHISLFLLRHTSFTRDELGHDVLSCERRAAVPICPSSAHCQSVSDRKLNSQCEYSQNIFTSKRVI